MKNFLFFVLGIVFFFVMSNAAVAGGVKAPKELCLKVNDSTMVVICLSTKATGSIKFADNQKIKYYSIDGTYNQQGAFYPIGGTGYMNGDMFRFHIDGQFSVGDNVYRTLDGYIDISLDPPAGEAHPIVYSDGGQLIFDDFVLEAMPCGNIGAPIEPIL